MTSSPHHSCDIDFAVCSFLVLMIDNVLYQYFLYINYFLIIVLSVVAM